MTPDQFKAWRKARYASQTAAAEALGLSRGSVENYEKGERRGDSRAVEIPKTVELACAALPLGITAYDGEGEPVPDMP